MARASREDEFEIDNWPTLEPEKYGSRKSPRDAIELKFNDTLEEVFALKRILQEFLSEPPAKVTLTQQAPSKATDARDSKRLSSPLKSQTAFSFPDKELDPADFGIDGSNLRPQIRASRGSERMLRNSVHFEPNFQARMRYYMTKGQLKKAQIQAEVEEKTKGQLKLAPAINQRSKRIHRSVDHLHAWNNEREQKLEQMRAAERAREMEEVTGVPQVCRESRKMCTKRMDDIVHCKVEDRLHLLGLIYEYQQEEREIRAVRQDPESFKPPRLAPHSSGLLRRQDEPTYERLHDLSNKPKPEPQTDSLATRPGKPQETVDAAIQRLAEIGNEYQNRRKEMAKQRELQLRQMQAPHMSGKSRVLAEQARSKAAQGQCNHHRKCHCCQQPEDTQTSPIRQVDTAQAASIYDRQVQWKEKNERRWREQKEMQEIEEDLTLTFRNPHYGAAWGPLDEDGGGNNRNVQHRDHSSTSFFEKSVRWASERDQKLEQERKLWDAIQLRDCTFRPQLTTPPPQQKEDPLSPRLLAKKGGVKATQSHRPPSRSNLATPMLSIDASIVSMDDCLEESDADEQEPSGSRRGSRVTFYDQGQQVRPTAVRTRSRRANAAVSR